MEVKCGAVSEQRGDDTRQKSGTGHRLEFVPSQAREAQGIASQYLSRAPSSASRLPSASHPMRSSYQGPCKGLSSLDTTRPGTLAWRAPASDNRFHLEARGGYEVVHVVGRMRCDQQILRITVEPSDRRKVPIMLFLRDVRHHTFIVTGQNPRCRAVDGLGNGLEQTRAFWDCRHSPRMKS